MPKFPFTNYHELNLDWILKKVEALFTASEENARTIRTYDTRLNSAEQTATSAATAATSAQQLADAAAENADSALSVAGTADSKADSALTAATNAAGAVAGALTTAQEAQQTAAAAVATANDAAATASSLESLANTANQNATAALETAQTADQKAVAAQTAATTNAGNISTLQTNVSNLNRQISDLESALDEISEPSVNLLDMSNLVIGKNWIGQDSVARAVVYVDVLPNTTYYLSFPENTNIQSVDAVQKASASSGDAIKSTNIITTGTPSADIQLTTESATNVICIQFSKGSIALTESDFANYHPYIGTESFNITAKDVVSRNASMPWSGKSMVWLGTSIPAAGKYNMPVSYPLMVGDILGATVHNEAVGSSVLHCKSPDRISTANPYGFLTNFEAVSRCITNSLEEMEWIIEHFNDTSVFTQNVPARLSDADKEFIRSCSWEIKLRQKYFNDNFPDVWIIDHGHNDIPSVASESTYTEKESMTGTQNNGYYSGGNFVTSTASSYIEYDVTNELYVWINGTFGSWYDVYDIYDSNGNNIGYTRNAVQTEVNALKVDVANASVLRVSNINTLLNTVTVQKLKYPNYNSLYSYQGAFDFIVNKILTYNPRARIIMIGEYENQKYPTISENQLIASERWEFPIYKQWENLGWSQQLIQADGTYKTMLNIILPDNLHPHTDTTGFALKTMAENIAAWLNTIR